MHRVGVKKEIHISWLYEKLIVLYMSFLILGNTFQFEPPYYIILVISILTVFFSSRRIERDYIKQYFFIFFFALYGIIIAIITNGGIGAPITIVTGLMVLYAARKIKFDKFDVTILVLVMIISILYWLYRSPTYYDVFFYNHWKGDGTLTNSNGVGHYLAYEGAFLFIIMSLSNRKWLQIGKWMLAIGCIWGCYNVKSRMALFTLLLFLIVNVIVRIRYKYRKTILTFFLYFSVFFEIIFPVIYLLLYKMGFGLNIEFFGLAEKGLYSGRQSIWRDTFETLHTIPEWLFGIGSKQNFWKDGLLNMHNNVMNLMVVMGIIGVIVYISYLITYIKKNFDFNNCSFLQIQCMIFFICIIFEGATDITLFYNSFLGYYFIPLGIALNNNYSTINFRRKRNM